METDKEYLTLDEVAEYVKIKKVTLYHYFKDLNIKTLRFGRDRRVFLTRADAELIKKYKEEPWKFEKKEDVA